MNLKTLFAALLVIVAPAIGAAQPNPFTAAITVNNQAITYYEITQRANFHKVLGTLGDLDKIARRELVNERLQSISADRLGIKSDDATLKLAMDDFIGRANMTEEQFKKILAKDGVAEETFRDYTRQRLIWSSLIRALFLNNAKVSDAEVDRALALSHGTSGASVHISELILPMTPEVAKSNGALAEKLVQALRAGASFADAAQNFSVSPSADSGGDMGWLPIGRLPPQILSLMLVMSPGDVTDPIKLQNAVAIFKMRGLREKDTVRPKTVTTEYLKILTPGGEGSDARAKADKLAEQLDTCDDFFGYADEFPKDAATRTTQPFGEVPSDIALDLARLDTNEISISKTRDGNILFLMLCGRTTAMAEGSREEVRKVLFSQRLDSYANSLLEELRADAIMIEK